MFEFYFVDQMLGKHGAWWDKLFPVLTLLIGVGIARGLAWFDKRRKDKRALHDLLTEIDLLDEPVKRQMDSLEEVFELLKKRTYEGPRFRVIALLNMERIKQIDRTAIVDHLTRLKKSRREATQIANTLLTGCDIISSQYAQLREVMEDFMDHSSTIYERWRNVNRSITMTITKNMADIEREGRTVADHEYMAEAIKLSLKAIKKPTDLFELFESFHKPLHELNMANKKDPKSDRLAELNYDAIQAIHAIDEAKKTALTKLQAVQEAMSTQYKKLKSAAKEIQPST